MRREPLGLLFISPCPLTLTLTLTFSGSARGRWYKFNDTVVEEFDMNDETLEYECFGGEYRPKVYDQCKHLKVLLNAETFVVLL